LCLKVDVARAMLALDKLMRANGTASHPPNLSLGHVTTHALIPLRLHAELNFQLFAVTPAILLVGGVTRYLYRRITQIDGTHPALARLLHHKRNVGAALIVA
jgi:hypothetical protein